MASKADNLEGEKADNGSEKEHARDFPADGNGDTLMECADNSRGSDNKLLHHNWSQTWSSVTIQLDVGRVLNDEDFITKDFLDHRADILLTDGRYWSCLFVHPIDADKSRLFWRSNALIIVLMKKTANVEWLDLQAIQAQPTTESTPAGAEGGVAAEVTRDQEESPEDQTKKEEPVKVIEHAKHSWFETNDLMTLHVFVKEINKDSLRVIYQDKFVTIKFQSNDGKFLEINKVQDPETSFLWRISLKGEIEPSQCKHRLMSTKVEVFLKKRLPIRWSALEAPTQTGQSSPAHNIWHPVATSAPKAPAPPPPPCVKPVSFTVGSKPLVSSSQSLASSLKNRSRALFGRGSSSESDDESQSNGDTRQLTNANSQKPTCKVSPLNKSSNSKVITSPGMTGLDNLGNTCFMNSTLQVLANTKGFREFFLDSVFQKDINTDNPLGCGGQLAVSFAVLLKVLWAGTQYSYAPAKLKNLVASKNSQFSGFAQHDAQEFLAFLLDGLHEDLNRIKHKPYIENKDSDGRSDMEVADEQWDLYRQRNDSAIVDLFQGQYKSTVICPKCSKVSITFDPYMYLSVPIPKQKVMIPVYFVSKDLHTKPVKYVLGLSKDARGADLTKAVSQRTGIPAKDLRAFEVYKCRFHRFFERTSDLAGLTSNDLVFVFEVLSEELAGEPVVELNVIQRVTCPVAHPTRCAYCQRECDVDTRLKRCTKCLRVGYCNQGCQRDHWQVHRTRCRDSPEPVGHPFMVSLPRSKLSYSRLAQAMQSFAIHSVDVFQPPVKDSLSSVSSDLSLSESMEAGSDQDTSSLSNDTFLDNANGNTGSAKSCTVTRTDKEDTWVDNGVAMDTKYEKCEDMLDQLVDTCLQDSSDLGTKSNKNLDNQFLKNDNEVNYDKSAEIREKTSAQTRVVLGYPQVEPVVALNFWMKPVNHQGIGLPAPKGTRLTDQGDSPLDLTSGQYLAMDWKNNERSKQYVMVQTKELDYVEDSQAGSSGRSESKEISLHHCLQLFTEPEVLSPEEAWYCPRCKKHVEASKQMAIWRLPHTLIIHLKRFSFRNFIWRDKIDRFIDFPVSGLDMSEFFVGVNQLEDPPPVYDLYGVINHHGGILGGHYTSYARLPSEIDSKKNDLGWRLFDDSRVRYANPNNIVSTAGYVLFYRLRCATPSLCTNPLPTGKSKVNQDKLKMECSSDESNDELDFGDSSNSPQEVPGVTRHTVSPESDEMAGGDVGRPLNNLTTAPSDEGCHVYTGPSYTDMESVD